MLKFKMDYFYFKIYYLDNVYNILIIIYKNTVKEPKHLLILTILVLIGT